MEIVGAQEIHASPQVAPDKLMLDEPTVSQPAPHPPQMAASVPPPSPLEPSAPKYQQRAQSYRMTNSTGPPPPAISPSASHQPAEPPTPNPNVNGHASPGGQHNPQDGDQYTALANMIKTSKPGIVRQVLRDHWAQCFLGSEYHTAFVLNTTLHQSSAHTLNRAVSDFGKTLVSTSKAQLLQHFEQADYDELAALILTRVSTKFLDRALAQRVETIEAKSLCNILARAERLGFSVEDIVEERAPTGGNGKREQVIPSLKDLPLEQLQWPSPQQSSLSTPQRELGLVECAVCKRPCSGAKALQYHSKKAACDPDFALDDIGKNICPHCGCSFGSSGGVKYHIKSEVCGEYTEETCQAVYQALQALIQDRDRQNHHAGRAQARAAAASAATSVARPSKSEQASHSPSKPPQLSQPPPHPSSHPVPREDPYKDLNPQTLARFHEEIARAEETYGEKLRAAMLLPEPESTDKLSRHKNAYNAKVSTTRKRYGIRLRERRSKEEVDAERTRLLQVSDAPEVWLEQERKARELERSNKRAFGDPNGPGVSTPATGTPTQPSQHQQNGPPVESPRKRIPLSEMGGLSGSAGSAEVVDPTVYQTSPAQPRGFAQMQHQQPPTQMDRIAQETQGDPIVVDSSSDTTHRQEASGSETESSGDDGSDGDIPAA